MWLTAKHLHNKNCKSRHQGGVHAVLPLRGVRFRRSRKAAPDCRASIRLSITPVSSPSVRQHTTEARCLQDKSAQARHTYNLHGSTGCPRTIGVRVMTLHHPVREQQFWIKSKLCHKVNDYRARRVLLRPGLFTANCSGEENTLTA